MEHSISAWMPSGSFLQTIQTIRTYGQVAQVIGLVVESIGPPSAIGDICHIQRRSGTEPIPAEVVGFRDHKMLLMPLGDTRGIEPGCRIVPLGVPAQAHTGHGLLGRVLDGLGSPIDGKGPVSFEKTYPLYADPPHPFLRQRITQPLDVGVKAVNGLLTLGKGQRVAIFSGSGVGKSTLLGMMARHTTAQVNVVALIGERGREVREFIDKDLGEEGLRRSVVVVATSELKQGMKGGVYLLAKEFEETCHAELFRKERTKGEILREITEEQERLVDLMKERKILNRLKEKSWKQFHRQMEKQEQKTVDEIVTCKPSDKNPGFGKIF